MANEGRYYRLGIVVDLQDRMQSALEKVHGAAEKFEQRLKNTSRAAQMLDRQKIAPTIDGKDKLSSRISAAQNALRSLTTKTWTVTLRAKDEVSRMTSRAGNALSTPVGMLGMGAATMGAGALVAGSMNKAMDFEAQLSSIKALTGATGEEMVRLRALSLKLGADTKYSALEAAKGFEELLKAGMSVDQVFNGGAEAALNLATAGGLGLAEAAEIMSTAMNAFKADGLSAAEAANILAGTANASATGVAELKFSLAAVAAVASGVGMSFQDTNAALGVFANNGLKGSDAGTSLKTMLMNLIPDSKKTTEEFRKLGLLTEQGTSAFFNQEGRLKSLTEISDLLRKSMAGMTDEQRLLSMQTMFGSDAIRAANILYKEGADGIRKFTSEMKKVTALDVAKEKMANAKGAVEQLSGAFETLQIRAMSPFLPLVSRVAGGIGDALDGATETVVARAEEMAAKINGFINELASDGKFQAMDWGDKIVYVLDRMIAAIDQWSSGPGGEQLGKVFTKLAEIGMRSWMAALGGLMKGSLNSLLSGNITGAVGLAMGANFLGAGSLIKGGYGLAKGAAGKLSIGKSTTTAVAESVEASVAAPKTTPVRIPPAATASGAAASTSAARLPAGYKPAGADFWGGADLTKVESRNNIVSVNNAGKLQRYNDIQTAFEGAPKDKMTLFQKGAAQLKNITQRVQLATEGTKVGSVIESAGAQGGRAAGWMASVAKSPLGSLVKRVAMPLGIGLDAYGVAKSENKVQAAGSMAGRWGGAWLGGKAGAAGGALVGSAVPGLGTAAGALVGGIGGSIAGFFGGEKVGTYLGEMASKLDFSAIKAKFVAAKDGIMTAVESWFTGMPERIGYAVGYSVTWLSQLPARGAAYFGQLVDEAEAYVSALPGRLASWWEQTFNDASAWAAQTVTGTMNWFSSLPEQAETAWKNLYQAVDTWASNTYNSVADWFSKIPGMIGEYWDQAINSITSKAGSLWDRATSGFSAGQAAAAGPVPAHAAGGIFNRPHMALFAEEGAESIIPLNPNRRARALDLWQQTGEALGIRQYATGGMTAALAAPGLGSIGGFGGFSPILPPALSDGGSRAGELLSGMANGAANILRGFMRDNDDDKPARLPQISTEDNRVIRREFSDTGVTAIAPAPAPPAPAAIKRNGGITVEHVEVSILNETDEEAMALRIGRTIVEAAKRKAENSAE